jgi:hypothetical protein
VTLSEYSNKKYSKGKERDSFSQRAKGYDLDTNSIDFFNHLILNQYPSHISNGISLLNELEIREADLEEVVLDYCRQLLSDSDFSDRNSGKSDIFESILWTLAEIGSVNSLEFLQDLIYNEIDKFEVHGNLEHVLSASQYSFYQINRREVANFFITTRSIKEVPVKTQSEIDDLRKVNPKYAEFQQFLLDNYKKYEGGTMN